MNTQAVRTRRRWRELLGVWLCRSQGRRELREMTPQRMCDLGLTELQVRAEARKWFWQA